MNYPSNDDLVLFITTCMVIGSIAFGAWQGSFCASVFAFCSMLVIDYWIERMVKK